VLNRRDYLACFVAGAVAGSTICMTWQRLFHAAPEPAARVTKQEPVAVFDDYMYNRLPKDHPDFEIDAAGWYWIEGLSAEGCMKCHTGRWTGTTSQDIDRRTTRLEYETRVTMAGHMHTTRTLGPFPERPKTSELVK